MEETRYRRFDGVTLNKQYNNGTTWKKQEKEA